MARERDILLSHADEVASWGGNISIETHGFIENTSYTAFPEMHARFVEEINHPGIGLCIDFGHSFLSAQWNGFDYMEGIARMAPLTTHFHVQDNMGISAYSGRTSFALGRGDCTWRQAMALFHLMRRSAALTSPKSQYSCLRR